MRRDNLPATSTVVTSAFRLNEYVYASNLFWCPVLTVPQKYRAAPSIHVVSMSAAEQVAQRTTPIEADQTPDYDSGVDDDASTYTESLRSTLLESVSENGRGYHKYRDGSYFLPEDEREQERLDMQHTMMLKLFGGKLSLVPFEKEPSHALDLGTGTGIWAIDFADTYPDCQVVGVDLSPMQPSFVPPNCRFEVDDYDAEWTYKQKFDLIHGRLMVTSMAKPEALFRKAYDNIAPGGWFELQDLLMPLRSDDDTLSKDSAFHKWNSLFEEAVSKMGRNCTWATEYKRWMEEAGFVNVQQLLFKLPINTWPKDRTLKELGKWNLINMVDGLEGYTVRPFTKVLGMSVQECEDLMTEVRKDLHNKAIHSYWPM